MVAIVYACIVHDQVDGERLEAIKQFKHDADQWKYEYQIKVIKNRDRPLPVIMDDDDTSLDDYIMVLRAKRFIECEIREMITT